MFFLILVALMDKSSMRTIALSQKMLASTCICFGSEWKTQCIFSILLFKHSCYTLCTCAPLLIASFLLDPRDASKNWDILYYGAPNVCQEDGERRWWGTKQRNEKSLKCVLTDFHLYFWICIVWWCLSFYYVIKALYNFHIISGLSRASSWILVFFPALAMIATILVLYHHQSQFIGCRCPCHLLMLVWYLSK